MVSTKIQIRFSDCDMLQHVNNATYFQYFETARINFFTQCLPDWDWKKEGIILARNVIDYKIPLFLEDHCEVEVSCLTVGNSSFTLAYHVYAIHKGEKVLKSYGESVLVCFDFTQQKTIAVPEKVKTVLEKNRLTV
ncbi:acyl-CoA thioesterase [Putridiphycobacter roseus]|uniref:Acyl-CoA thioesterase n=1 Tax=Putridiphycobacter roseus TaxID=2219161 RepID=A0A2W1N0Z9_9FLAO|nr:thioesterase family protein [Putridiphycobacter roseus]PZE17937.1 acyl-CoA thioesterase [Putridiphycobacter roseus]